MPDETSRPASGGRPVLAATILASGAVFLLTGTVSIALPSVQSYFGGDLSGLQWVVNAQLLTLAALIPAAGALGDRFGRKRVLLLGLALFTVMGVLSGLAQSISQLVVFQAMQGVGSALIVPQSLAVINVSFEPGSRGQAIGLWAGLSGALSALGPWVGGLLVQSYTWRAVFFLPAVLSVVGIAAAWPSVRESLSRRGRGVDWVGALLLFSGLLGIAYALISGGPWTGWVALLSLGGGVVALAVFSTIETKAAAPMVPMSIFRNPLVSGANLATLFLYSALSGVTFFSVLDLQQVQGYSPSGAGLALLPVVAAITVLSAPAGWLSDRIGPRLQMISGPLVVAVGIGLLMTGGVGAPYFVHFFPGFLLVGVGMGLVIAPLTKSALSVKSELSGAASGVNNAVARMAALLAIAILGVVVLTAFTMRLSESLSLSDLSREQRTEILSQSGKLGGIEIPSGFDAADRAAAQAAIRSAFVYGFRWAMGASALMALGAAVVSALMIRNPVRTDAGERA